MPPRSSRCMPPRRCSGLRASSASGSRCRRSRSCWAGRRSRRWPSACCACAPGARAVRRAPRRQRRRAGAALAQLLRGDPGVDGGRRPARLRELSRSSRCSRERVFFARPLRRREGVTALLVTAGPRAARARSSRSRTRVVQGLAWGIVSGFTFALLVVMNRRWAGTRSRDRHRLLAERLAALALLPFASGGRGSPWRRSARATSCC